MNSFLKLELSLAQNSISYRRLARFFSSALFSWSFDLLYSQSTYFILLGKSLWFERVLLMIAEKRDYEASSWNRLYTFYQ